MFAACRALGAKIGKGVIIDSANIFDWDLIEIGDNVGEWQQAGRLGCWIAHNLPYFSGVRVLEPGYTAPPPGAVVGMRGCSAVLLPVSAET